MKNDSLFWELPVNTCGPFVSYDIYTSDSPTGPFTLLTSVTNPAQDFFLHPNPAGNLRYYYLAGNFNCPGLVQLSSDTLDSRPPEISPLRSVSVAGNSVLLDWQPSPSPEVYAYIVYRRDPIGVIPIDTVFGGLTNYTDPNADPANQSVGYFVNALDRCGNTSIFDQEHKTVFLSATPTNCSIDLTWNLYQSWSGGIGSQELWAGVNGGLPVLVETLGGGVSSFSFRNVNDGDSYCFFLQAVENGSGATSRSNLVCFGALSFSQPVNELYFTGITVQPDNSVGVDWGINANADLATLEYFRSDLGAFLELFRTDAPTVPFPVSNRFVDQDGEVENGQVSFQLRAVDLCGNERTTATATTVFLAGNPLDIATNQLNWTPLILENAVVTGYSVIRTANGTETEIGTTTANDLMFVDVFDPSALSTGTLCYIIEADAILTLPDGAQRNTSSRSNLFCIDQAIRIFTPNALAPEGFNQEFKPVILSGNIAKYEMEIFDRYGQIVFTADDPDVGWKGKKDGKKLPQGVYVFRIFLTLENGKFAERKGHVLLLR